MKIFTAMAVFALAGAASANVVGVQDFDSGHPYDQTPPEGTFTSPGDGFQVFQRNVSPTIPFSLLDDSASIFPGDSLGIIGEDKLDAWFGVTDTDNADNPDGTFEFSTSFDVTGFTDLAVDIDMGAMGDFESSDIFDWTYSIDGGAEMALFTSSVDEDGSADYTMDDGMVYTLDDPLLMNGTLVDNDLSTFSAPVTGTGSTLTLYLRGYTNGGSEAYAFDNIVVTGIPAPGSLALLGLGGLIARRRR